MISNIKNAVNKLPDYDEFFNQKPEYEIEIKQDGKVIYKNKVYALTAVFVQSLTKFNYEDSTLEGDTQIFSVGHPIIQVFAFDQLRVKLAKLFKKGYGMLRYIDTHREEVKPEVDSLIESWNKQMKGFKHKDA